MNSNWQWAESLWVSHKLRESNTQTGEDVIDVAGEVDARVALGLEKRGIGAGHATLGGAYHLELTHIAVAGHGSVGQGL